MPHVMTYKEERRGLEKKRGRWLDLVILRGPMHVYSSQKVYKMNPSLSRPGTLLRWPWETVNKSHKYTSKVRIHTRLGDAHVLDDQTHPGGIPCGGKPAGGIPGRKPGGIP